MLRASMLVIGDEILGGYVRDDNAAWLARHLQPRGVPLDRVHTVPDDLDAIGEALQAERVRPRPRIVVTSGGMGSTPDDITFEAVAKALGRRLTSHPVIREHIEASLAWQAEQGIEVTDAFRSHMLRMARIPDGGRLLSDQGWVPGIRVDLDGGAEADTGLTIVILPGVPAQFRRIMADVVSPGLLDGRNPRPQVVEIEHHLPESVLNLTFAAVLDRHPDVRLGSYPGTPMLIRLSGAADDVNAAAAFVRGRLDALLASDGGSRLAAAWTARSHPSQESTT